MLVSTVRSLYLLYTVSPRWLVRALRLPLGLLLLPMVSEAQAAPDAKFTPGVYQALPRDSTAVNRYRWVEFDFQATGLLLWRRGSMIEQIMGWRASDDTFEVEDTIGCSAAPTGRYRLVPWMSGFAMEVIRDGCTARAAAVNEFYLVPKRVGEKWMTR